MNVRVRRLSAELSVPCVAVSVGVFRLSVCLNVCAQEFLGWSPVAITKLNTNETPNTQNQSTQGVLRGAGRDRHEPAVPAGRAPACVGRGGQHDHGSHQGRVRWHLRLLLYPCAYVSVGQVGAYDPKVGSAGPDRLAEHHQSRHNATPKIMQEAGGHFAALP